MKLIRRKITLIIVLIGLLTYSNFGFSSANVIRRRIMDNFFVGIKEYVTDVLNDSTLNYFIWSLMLFFVFLVVVIEIVKFIFDGLDMIRIFEASLWCFFSFGLYALYPHMTNAIWNAGTGIGDVFQEIAVGNKDPFFLPMWTWKTLNSALVSEVSIWDSIGTILIAFLWGITVILLSFVMWLASLYAVFGYAMSKIIGLLFIPFIMISGTRKFFDAWLRFFIGFVMLSILLRISAILIAILIKAQFSTAINFDSTGIPTTTVAIPINSALLFEVIATGFVAIIFVLSSFNFSSQLGGGIGSGAGALGKGISIVSRLIIK